MSTALYEMLALTMRYLFAFLGFLIVLRTFWGIVSDHARRKARVRSLPFSETIGEFVTLTGSPELPEGWSVAVPWEGVMGSVRSCDVYLPGSGVFRNHLTFSFKPGQGLILKLFSGREAVVNDTPVDCRSPEEDLTLRHGDFLQIGGLLLRLRLYAALDPAAGFVPAAPEAAFPAVPGGETYFAPPASFQAAPLPEAMPGPAVFPGGGVDPAAQAQSAPAFFPAESMGNQVLIPSDPAFCPAGGTEADPVSRSGTESFTPPAAQQPAEADAPQAGALPADGSGDAEGTSAAPRRRRRRNEWEADWSE